MKDYKGKIKLVVKFLPFRYRDYSRIAALSAIFAWKKGKFSEMHELLLAKSPNLDMDSLTKYAEELGLNKEEFKRALDEQRGSEIIEGDIKMANSLDVFATPALFINGIKILGVRNYEYLSTIVSQELKRLKKD